MSKHTHKEKVKIANRLMTKDDQKYEIPRFQTKAWETRKKNIADRVKRKQNKKQNASN